MYQKTDLHQDITDKIIESIENNATGEWKCPWTGAKLDTPRNARTGEYYNGINILRLWAQGYGKKYDSGEWATFKQWKEVDASVRKGEKSTRIMFCKIIKSDEDSSGDASVRVYSKAYPVFNAAQVEGYEPEAKEPKPLSIRLEGVETFVAKIGAVITEGGISAHYNIKNDDIHIPLRATFKASKYGAADEHYYATLLHELTHWTGAEHRLNRQIRNSKSSDEYAFEELVAELGSAFLCAELGIALEPRQDHAKYIGHWLSSMKEDKRVIFKAAHEASRAVQYLRSLQSHKIRGEAA